MPRSRKVQISLQKKKVTRCPFCNLEDREIISRHKYFLVIKNDFPYANWDASPVSDHLMIVPKNHDLIIQNFSEEESQEYLLLTSEYMNKGYSAYTRSSKSPIRSQVHFHTHFILTTTKVNIFELTLRKPYINIFR